jgi:hypothetical protein
MKLVRFKMLIVAVFAVTMTTSFTLVLAQHFPACQYAFGRRGNLTLTMKTYQYAVRMSGSIDVVLQLRNLGSEEAELRYSNSHVMDLFLYSLDGKLVTWESKRCGFLQVLTDITLQPGDVKEWQISWNSYSRIDLTIPGLYLLEGSVLYFGTNRLPMLILP